MTYSGAEELYTYTALGQLAALINKLTDGTVIESYSYTSEITRYRYDFNSNLIFLAAMPMLRYCWTLPHSIAGDSLKHVKGMG